MRIVVPKETKAGELRVALVPDIISKLTKAGLEVIIESNAGRSAEYSDAKPAFDSITTSRPALVNLEIMSGTSATRFSPALISLATATRIF